MPIQPKIARHRGRPVPPAPVSGPAPVNSAAVQAPASVLLRAPGAQQHQRLQGALAMVSHQRSPWCVTGNNDPIMDLPDAALTRPAPAPVPIPFPNMAMGAAGSSFAPNVLSNLDMPKMVLAPRMPEPALMF